MRLCKQHYATVAIAVIATALFVLSTEPYFGPTNRFRVIMVAILGNAVALIWLVAKNNALLSELRDQHRAATYVKAARGMLNTVRMASEDGLPMPFKTRQAIYAAMEEQFELHDQALGAVGTDEGVASVFTNG